MFNLFPHLKPSLPQNDSKREQDKRQKQLANTQKSYIWDTNNPNVAPVPLVKEVPREAYPTLTWGITVLKVLVPIVENLVANVKDAAELVDIKEGVAEVSDALDSLKPGQQLALITNTTAMLNSLIEMYLKLVREEVKEYREGAGLDAYKALFKKLPLPAVAEVFQQNDCFARYRVAGQNPMLIRGVSRLADNFPVSEAGYQKVMGPNDSLAEALAEKRIYIVDYHELQMLADNSQGPEKKVFAPIALFAIPKDGKDITPVAIQNGQDPSSAVITYAVKQNDDTPEYRQWQAAMTMVQVADGNYHELFVHLGRTHLIIEAFTIATNRCLAESHPVNILLLPHFEGTLFINNSAANSLIAAGGPIDNIFGGKIEATQKAAGTDRLQLDFYQYMLPNDLAARNVDNMDYLPDYPYRDDAILIWEAIKNWTQAYINIYYTNDTDVTEDYELAAWTTSLMTEGAIKGFKPITTREQLADVLTMVIFTSSAQHAAVNFPQRDLMSFAPAVTGAFWAENPVDVQTEEAWLQTLPPLTQSLEQLSLLEILGGVYYRHLGEYRSNNFPYLDWFEDPRVTKENGPLSQFKASLADIEQTINIRNKTRQEYNYLLPSKIPPSINI
ncbi:lipoxygenase [Photobacterium sp. SDRW27]|uniref:lipoxygenase family protein n=1 Tax=Photobacterium obscurum TaxID=2829490 RepID=UPI00224385AE|nr:lipoxygenase family protein [Photobacterium obscurum]MCW8329858.1 lipoxygenase [Photobacterium obscurum]